MKDNFPEKNNIMSAIAIAGIVFVVASYMWLVYSRALNIPWNDELHDVLQFLIRLSNAETMNEGLAALLEQHADHRTATSRVFYVVSLLVEGDVNFRTLAIAANVVLIFYLVLFYQQLANANVNYKAVVLFIICLLLFHPRAHYLMIWPMAGLAFFGVYVYCFAALHYLEKRTPFSFVLAIFFTCLATLTMASGQFVWFAGLAFLIYLRITGKAVQNRYAILWALLSIAVLAAYHHNYTTSLSMTYMLTFVLKEPVYVARFVFALIGSGFGFGNVLLSQLLGGCALLALCWFTYRGFKEGLSALYFFAWFIMLTILIMAFGRAPAATFALFNAPAPLLEYALRPRYSFASMLLLATLFSLWATAAKPFNLRQLYALIIAGLAFSSANYLYYTKQLDQYREDRIKRFNKVGVTPLGYSKTDIDRIMEEAASKGIYSLPPRPLQTK